jgi:hypothetical protein
MARGLDARANAFDKWNTNARAERPNHQPKAHFML